MTPDLVIVRWRDAWFDFDEPDELQDEYIVSTVGYLVRPGPRFVTVAQELLPHGDGHRALTHIPLAVVETVAVLEEITHDANGHDPGGLLLRAARNGQRQGVSELLPIAAALDPA
jgi:hypothetical protein